MNTNKTQETRLRQVAALRQRVAELEEWQQQAYDACEQRIKERTAALTKANGELTHEIVNLRWAEERFAKAFHCNPSPMAISTSENRFLEVNQALLDTLQYSRDEVIGATASDLGLFADPERQLAAVSILDAEGRLRDYALDVRTKTGQIRHGLFSGEIIQLHDQQVMLTVMEDVTERQQAESAVRESEARLQFAQHIAKIGTFEWDMSKDVNSWTAELEAMYGLPPGGFPGTQTAWENLIHADDRDGAVRLVEQTLSTGEPVKGEWRVVWPDGTVHWLAGRWQAFHDESGTPLRMIGVNIDITDRKRAEESLRQNYEALQRQHRTLQHLLQSSDHERQTIAYEIHDELAQQLTGAIMQFEVFNHIKSTKPQQAVDAHQAGMTLLRQAHREARRLIAGVRPPILDEAGIVDAVSHLVNELRREKGPKIEFRNIVEFDRLVPILENAAYRITQEALANACRHSGSEKVCVTLLQQGNHLRIEVRDWGAGFETKANLKNHYGLEGIRQRAKLLGGKCSIQSKLGKGTRVIVELPVVLRA